MRSLCQSAVLLALVALAGCGSNGSTSATPASNTTVVAKVQHVRPKEARQLLTDNPGMLVLDVRPRDQFTGELGVIDGAKSVPADELEGRIPELSAFQERPVMVVDGDGSTSRFAATRLTNAGFGRVYQLEGGMNAWRRAATD